MEVMGWRSKLCRENELLTLETSIESLSRMETELLLIFLLVLETSLGFFDDEVRPVGSLTAAFFFVPALAFLATTGAASLAVEGVVALFVKEAWACF